MMKRLHFAWCLTALLAGAGSLNAQLPPTALTHVGLFKVKPDKASEWVAGIKKLYIPVFERLMKEGAMLGYGIDAGVLHRAGETNMEAWFMVPDWAGYEKVNKAIDEAQTKNPTLLAALTAATDPDKHHDQLLRSVVGSFKKPAEGTLPFTHISATRVKPGKSQEFREMFEKYAKPVYERLLAEGVINGYSLDQEAEHGDDPGGRFTVTILPNLAARDKMIAAFEEENKRRTEQERQAVTARFLELTEAGAHRDHLLRAIVFAWK